MDSCDEANKRKHDKPSKLLNVKEMNNSKNISNKQNHSSSDDITEDKQTTKISNDIFIASGPYFAQFNASCDDDLNHRSSPSTSRNCNVVFSNIENLENELQQSVISNERCNRHISKSHNENNEINKSRGLKKLLQPFGSHSNNKNHDCSSSPLKQTKKLSSSTVEMSEIGSTKINSNNDNIYRKEISQNQQSQSALRKLLSTSQELFNSKTKMHHPSSICQRQPTLLSIGVSSNSNNLCPSTSHSLTVPSSSSNRPRSSHDDYNDLQTVPEDYKFAFQQVFSKRPKILGTNRLLTKRHNRSKSLSQNFASSSTDSEDETTTITHKSIINSNTDDEPIHMTLEEVKAMMASKPLSNEDSNKNEIKKSKLKQAFHHLLHKTHNITNNTNNNTINFQASSSKSDISQNIPVSDLLDNSTNNNRIDLNIESMPSTSFVPSPVSPFGQRALPPVPKRRENIRQIRKLDSIIGFKMKNMTFEEREKYLLYLDSITSVKQCGWYWGPVSGEMAEKLLQNEPCGSFIVRDSSDEHYLFSLTFKLNGLIRHVRIEHDRGNFSFGPGRKYKNNTIVDFIEDAVEHSRNGQFLFFLHRVPIDGPDGVLRIQLLNPVSRFRTMQSLQHACRFAILKLIRRDQIHLLDLPDMIKIYLDTPFYFSEELQTLDDKPPPLSDQVKMIAIKKRKHFLRMCARYGK